MSLNESFRYAVSDLMLEKYPRGPVEEKGPNGEPITVVTLPRVAVGGQLVAFRSEQSLLGYKVSQLFPLEDKTIGENGLLQVTERRTGEITLVEFEEFPNVKTAFKTAIRRARRAHSKAMKVKP